jgi:hypothetical protein
LKSGLHHVFQAGLSYVRVLCGVTGLLEEELLHLALPNSVLNSNQAMEVVLRNIIIHPQPIVVLQVHPLIVLLSIINFA